MPYVAPPNAPKGIVVANRFMTARLEYIPRDEMRVDHFLVSAVTYHHGANADYQNIHVDRRIRADCNTRYTSPGMDAQNDIYLRIMQIPQAQKTSTRTYTQGEF